MKYSREFYNSIELESKVSAMEVVPRLLELVSLGSVIDVGCGTGVWLAVFRANGVKDLLGIDLDVNPADLKIPKTNYLPFDLSHTIALSRTFDLAVSLEVGEHLEESKASQFVDSLVGLAPVVLFSAAIPSQGGTHHQNEQWPGYWARHFQRHGYVPLDCLRREFWANERVAYWYAQNMVIYVSGAKLARYPALNALGVSYPLSLVHPLQYQRSLRRERPSSRQLLRDLPAALLCSMRNKLRGSHRR